MKSSFFVFIWSILIIISGVFIHRQANDFSYNYINDFNLIEEKIKDNNWEQASYILKDTKSNLDKEKSIWYMLINHSYFNEAFSSIEILNQSIYLEDKMISLQEIERVKMVFENLVEDESYNLNIIF